MIVLKIMRRGLFIGKWTASVAENLYLDFFSSVKPFSEELKFHTLAKFRDDFKPQNRWRKLTNLRLQMCYDGRNFQSDT